MLADALKAFNGVLQITYKIFPNVIDLPSVLPPHTPDTSLTVSPLIEPFSLHPSLHPHSLPPPYLIVIT